MKPHDLITAISTDLRELQSIGDLNRQADYGTNKPRTWSCLVIQLIFPSTTHPPPVPTCLGGNRLSIQMHTVTNCRTFH